MATNTKSESESSGAEEYTDANVGDSVFWYLEGPTLSTSEGEIVL